MLPQPHPGVVYQKLEDGAVLFAAATELYFGLNVVGAMVWELLPPRSHSMDELCAAMHAQFPEVEPTVIRADVDELLTRLLAEGLLTPAAPRSGDASSAA